MTVGMMRIRLRIPENQSLKGKRAVIKSLLARLQNRYNVAAAEVDENDRWQTAVIGIACVSNSAAHADEILSKVLGFVESERLDAEILEHEIEMVQAF